MALAFTSILALPLWAAYGPDGLGSAAAFAPMPDATPPTLSEHVERLQGPGRTGIPAPGAVHDRIATVSLRPPGPAYFSTPLGWLDYASAEHAFFVAVPPSSVDIITNVSGFRYHLSETVPVGSDPFGVAYDGANADVFVTNSGSNNVSVLHGVGSTPIASIGVGNHPTGIAYDPVNQQVYVANSGSDNVTVISASTLSVIANLPVGKYPIGVAADPASGSVYVANNGSNDVTVLSESTGVAITSISVGAHPYGVAVDNATTTVYVTNEGSNNVSAISESSYSVVAWIPVTGTIVDLTGITYDWIDGLLWIGGGRQAVVVVAPVLEKVVSYIFYDPSGIAFDPTSGNVCFTNAANNTFACVLASYGTVDWIETVTLTSSVLLNFTETGLPGGAIWNVSLTPYGPTFPAYRGAVALAVFSNWSYHFMVQPPSGYWATPSSGVVVVGSSGVTVAIIFSNTRAYTITFTSSGLPAGDPWFANITGAADLTSTGTSTSAALGNGTYSTLVSTADRFYRPVIASFTFNVSGSPYSEILRFLRAPLYAVTFSATGLAPGATWSVLLAGTRSTAASPTISFEEPNGSYSFIVTDSPGYSPSPLGGSVLIQGSSASRSVAFAAVPTSQSTPFPWFGLEIGAAAAIVAAAVGAYWIVRRPPPKSGA